MWITFVAQYETSYPQLILIIWDIDVDKTNALCQSTTQIDRDSVNLKPHHFATVRFSILINQLLYKRYGTRRHFVTVFNFQGYLIYSLTRSTTINSMLVNSPSKRYMKISISKILLSYKTTPSTIFQINHKPTIQKSYPQVDINNPNNMGY